MARTGLLTALVIVALAASAYAQRLAFRRPTASIGSSGPFVCYLAYNAPSDGSLTCTISGNGFSARAAVPVTAGSSGYESVIVPYSETLTVGETYMVTASLVQGDSVAETARRRYRAVPDDIKFGRDMSTLPAMEDPFELPLIYSSSVRRSLVVAIKNPADDSYLGSHRAYLEPGTNVQRTVQVQLRRGFRAGERCIIRADIRPVDGMAQSRLDRVETDSVAVLPGVAEARVALTPVPQTFPICRRVQQVVSYYNPGPSTARVIFQLRTASGTYLRARRRTGLAPGAGTVTVYMRLPDGIVAGRDYELRTFLRSEGDMTALASDSTMVRAESC
mmetsp:Transcript_11900/g.36265  ORF Transcript_11900/g.36265 Transcript_11900/m.36265 type:complete len:333 (-) Transcript_11900:44-1042(-)